MKQPLFGGIHRDEKTGKAVPNDSRLRAEPPPEELEVKRVDAGSSGSAPAKTETELLKMAVFWMRKSQDYSPPRAQDVGRMLKCASYIDEQLKQNDPDHPQAKGTKQ